MILETKYRPRVKVCSWHLAPGPLAENPRCRRIHWLSGGFILYLMDNQFHLLLEVPLMAKGRLSNEVLLSRLSAIYSEALGRSAGGIGGCEEGAI